MSHVLAGATRMRRFLGLPIVVLCTAASALSFAAVVVVVVVAVVSSSPHGSQARTTEVKRLSEKPPAIFASVLALLVKISDFAFFQRGNRREESPDFWWLFTLRGR